MSFLKFQAQELAKRIGREFVSSMSELSGHSDTVFNKLNGVQSWTILGYHRITDTPNVDPFDFGMCTSIDNFERQLEFLGERFEVETVQSALALIESGSAIEKPLVSITFDDGYLDNHTLALPILKKAGLRASFYICTSDLSNSCPFWWDRVIFALAHTQVSSLSLAQCGLDSSVSSLDLSPRKRRYALSVILQALWSVDYAQCLNIVERLEEMLQAKADQNWSPRMSRGEILELVNSGMEIGCHNATHHDMTMLDTKEVRNQLEQSGAEICDITGSWPTGFAYPAGANSDETRECVTRVGYEYALGTERGLNTWDCQRLSLKRMSVGNNSISDFKRCLASLANTHIKELNEGTSEFQVAGYK